LKIVGVKRACPPVPSGPPKIFGRIYRKNKRNFFTKARNFKNTKKNIYYFVLSRFRVFVIDIFDLKYKEFFQFSIYLKEL